MGQQCRVVQMRFFAWYDCPNAVIDEALRPHIICTRRALTARLDYDYSDPSSVVSGCRPLSSGSAQIDSQIGTAPYLPIPIPHHHPSLTIPYYYPCHAFRLLPASLRRESFFPTRCKSYLQYHIERTWVFALLSPCSRLYRPPLFTDTTR